MFSEIPWKLECNICCSPHIKHFNAKPLMFSFTSLLVPFFSSVKHLWMDALLQVLACIVTPPRGLALVEISKCSSSNVTWNHWYDGEDTGSIEGMNGHLGDGFEFRMEICAERPKIELFKTHTFSVLYGLAGFKDSNTRKGCGKSLRGLA